ncbi:MAG: beta-lactamase family protein [Armatimonadetes bacterium]|nr:beta-lactamase family protein [Armatimonadota bacterium]
MAWLPVVGCAATLQASSPEAVVRALVEALNTKDKAKIAAFVKAHATDDLPAETRVERMLDLAEQGAPFKIVGAITRDGNSLKLKLEDTNGIQLNMLATMKGDPPKLAGIRAAPAGASEATFKDYSDLGSLQDMVKAVVTDSKIPAMSASTIRAGKTETATFGVRELGTSAQPGVDEPWKVGSIGKSLCSTVIGTLIDEGKLKFETTLKEALPGFKMLPEYESVTLEQVMHHRSGLPADPGMRRPQVEAIIGDAKAPQEIRDKYIANVLMRKGQYAPGTRFDYSNAGYAVLAKVIEVATGQPYESALKQRVFQKLRLQHSFTRIDPLPQEHPSGHMPGPDGLKPVVFDGPMTIMFAGAGGGIWMSTSDLAKYGQAHLDGLKGKAGLLRPETVFRLHKGEQEDPEGNRSYGCGWGIVKERGLPIKHGHNGSDGTFRAELAIYPDLDLVVAAISNAGGESEPTPGELVFWSVAKRAQKG